MRINVKRPEFEGGEYIATELTRPQVEHTGRSAAEAIGTLIMNNMDKSGHTIVMVGSTPRPLATRRLRDL